MGGGGTSEVGGEGTGTHRVGGESHGYFSTPSRGNTYQRN